ncbi:MAG TPA: hypothetical protein P5515_10285 [Methanolinea sp.]|nr:hypothetical protein [Methanolinea sp.]
MKNTTITRQLKANLGAPERRAGYSGNGRIAAGHGLHHIAKEERTCGE